jgi:hypothetical protein
MDPRHENQSTTSWKYQLMHSVKVQYTPTKIKGQIVTRKSLLITKTSICISLKKITGDNPLTILLGMVHAIIVD